MKTRHHGPSLRCCGVLLMSAALSAHAQYEGTYVGQGASPSPSVIYSQPSIHSQPTPSQRADDLPSWTECVQTTIDLADWGRSIYHSGEAGVAADSSAAMATRTFNVSESGLAYASSRHMAGMTRLSSVPVPRASSCLSGPRRVGGFLLALLGVGGAGAACRNREE